MNTTPPSEIHPSARARTARAMRGLVRLRGWRRIASAVAGQPADGRFRVHDHGAWLEGDLGSHIEREYYLYGGFEQDAIDLFLGAIPNDRRGTILDIGANVGTHALRFAQAFDRVLAFEPNPQVVDRLRRNLALSAAANVEVHQVGLSDSKGELDLFAPENGNQGLGTFLTEEQYDSPLIRIGAVPVEIGDDFVAKRVQGRVDAIKCDVQGFEVHVLSGLKQIVARDRPIMWMEIGSGAHTVAAEIAALMPLLPHPVTFFRMTARTIGILSHPCLADVPAERIGAGDWVIVPQ